MDFTVHQRGMEPTVRKYSVCGRDDAAYA